MIVSTDDEEIAHIAKIYGAEVPFLRPKELSDDFTGTELLLITPYNSCKIKENRMDLSALFMPQLHFCKKDILLKGLKNLKTQQHEMLFHALRCLFLFKEPLKLHLIIDAKCFGQKTLQNALKI